MRFLTYSALTAIAVWLVSRLPLGVSVVGGEDDWLQRILMFLIVGAVITALNFIVRPIVNLLTLPLRILTLGLFSLIIGWFMLWLTSVITGHWGGPTLEIAGFWKTLLAALLIAIATAIMSIFVPTARKR